MSEPTSVTEPSEEAGAEPASIRELGSDFLEALRGSHRDFTRAPLGRALLLVAVPMVLEMLMESLFAVVDVFFVARLGADAVATVGLTESMLTLVYTLGMGLGIGVTALVARRIGEGDPAAASRTAVQGIALGVVASIPIAIVGVVAAPRLLELMGAPASLVASGSGYTRTILGANAVVLLLFLVNSALRASGSPAVAMRVLWLANGINILLVPCLVNGWGPFPALGVAGSAVATSIGRGTGVAYALWMLASGRARIRVGRGDLRVDPTTMLRIVRLSLSATLQMLVGMASWIGLVRLLATFGSAALGGYTIAIRLVMFAILPSFGMSNAAATLVGQNLGAKKPERAEQAVWKACRYNAGFMAVLGLVFFAGAGPIVASFTHDAQVARNGVECLRVVSAGFLFYAFGMVLTQSFNGAGDTWTPTYINLFVFWLLELPLAWLLAKVVGMGPSGVFVSITLAFSTLAVVSAVIFRRGRWKLRAI